MQDDRHEVERSKQCVRIGGSLSVGFGPARTLSVSAGDLGSEQSRIQILRAEARLLKSLRLRLARDAPEDDPVVNGPRVPELLSLRVAMLARLIYSGLKRLVTCQNTPTQRTADANAVGPWANLFYLADRPRSAARP
jgi:hypothetical protein